MNETTYILEYHGITKGFPGVQALDDVSFKIETGTVHALVGENGAGKSTLMKVTGGAYIPEGGEVVYKGEKVSFLQPADALQKGIRTVYQELNLVEKLKVHENMFLGSEEHVVLRDKEESVKARAILTDYGLEKIDPRRQVGRLSIGERQLLEIAKSAWANPDLLIMDEPSSSLSSSEIEILFNLIKRLRKEGKTIIYISHKLTEVLEISDNITVLRDGKHVITAPNKEFTEETLITHMVNRKMGKQYPERVSNVGEVVLEVENLTRAGKFKDCSFTLHRGEILGFSGLMGAGRTELMRAVFGLDPYDSGTIRLRGKKVNHISPSKAKDLGMGFVSEDRRLDGLVLCRSTKENTVLPNLLSYSKRLFGVINRKQENEAVDAQKEALNIKYANKDHKVKYLSGGNQQKVILSKWLLMEPEILIMDEPTRGIDVGAKKEIYDIIHELSLEDLGVLLISSENDELLGLCDRIIVMHDGSIEKEFAREEANADDLLLAAFGRFKS